MIPIQDSIQARITPYVNYAFIAITSVVFLFQLKEPPHKADMVRTYGMIPARVRNPQAEIEIPSTRK